MDTTRILNQAQAEAVYSAMCALKNVSAEFDVTFGTPDDGINVYEYTRNGASKVHVHRMSMGTVIGDEGYSDQTAFAAAYGLHAPTAITQPLQAGEAYWVAFPNTGDVSSAVWGAGEADDERLEDGRCYRTEAEAWAAVNAA